MNIVRGGANTMAAVIEEEAEMDPNIQLLQGSIDQIAAGLTEVRADLRDLRRKQETDTQELRREIGDLGEKMDAKIESVRSELKAEISGLRAEVKADINCVRAEISE